MSTREATDTIIGYFYQFDKTILELLELDAPQKSICIEGIEDIDIINGSETTAVQCKYYAKTEYNHSVIKKPIVLMLRHFAKNREKDIKYHLYGHYKSGHEKLGELTCKYLKDNFLTSTNNTTKTKCYEHDELKLTDDDINAFLGKLKLDIKAPSFEEQYNKIIEKISSILDVSTVEAELYHYNSALKIIKELSIKHDREHRYITQASFLDRIRVKDEIFDAWFIRRKGRDKYIASIRKAHLTSGLNMEAFNRFFLIDCGHNENLAELEQAILAIAKKWSKISKRERNGFCPCIYVNGLIKDRLVTLKNNIYSTGTKFVDPYPFKHAAICEAHFYTQPSIENGIKFKLIDDVNDLDYLIDKSPSLVEIYQFYKDSPYFNNEKYKHVKIKIEDVSYIKDLVK